MRRGPSVAGILALMSLGAMSRLAAQDDTSPLSPDSNGGGNPITRPCGLYADVRTEVLIGIKGGSGLWVDWVGGICSEVTHEGKWVGSETETGASGVTSGTSFSIRCPRNSAVSALGGRASGGLDRLVVYCRVLGTNGALTGANSNAGETTGSTGPQNFGPNACPGNKPAVGWAGNFGRIPLGASVVERLGLICSMPNIAELTAVSLAAPSAVAPNDAIAKLQFSRVVPFGTSLALSSSAVSIARVGSTGSVARGSSNGTFRVTTIAGAGGCADISAKHAGIDKKVRLVVHAPVASGSSVTLTSPDQPPVVGSQLNLRVGTPLVASGVVTLSSSDPTIATVPGSVTTARVRNVDPSGSANVSLSAIREGCAVITATFRTGTARRTIMVQRAG